MKIGFGVLPKGWIVAGCLVLALQMGLAQNPAKKPVGTAPDATRAILVEKAKALESRGRPDMAIQLWQQILLSDPNNTEALAGLARNLKLIGNGDQAAQALDRLRRANPNDPNIAKIEALSSTRAESDQLRQAGELARQGKSDDAMKIYRQLYGDRPPDGDVAMAYYQTLYGTASGKAEAIIGMRALADRNPGDPRFAIELGTMLTYDPRTRSEGIRVLNAHNKDANAQSALRQALVWDAANPASANELKQYLKDHPQDQEVSGLLKQDEGKLAQMNSGIARNPAERAAFAALNAHHLEDAEARFTDLLQKEPKNGRVAAGMGFLRMQQSNFGGAISYLTQAEQNGYKDRSVIDGLATSRFWYTMGEASQAFDDDQLDVAQAKYQAALAMRPRSPEALNGLAGLLTKEQRFSESAGIYEQLARSQPGNVAGWRGLFMSYAQAKQNQKALAIAARFPGGIRTALNKDPDYLRTLASVYQAMNRPAEAEHVLALALSLPFPDNGSTLKADTKVQYAGVLMAAKRFQQAAELYTQILTDDPENLSAWMGMISAHHELLQDNEAIADVQKMPAGTYEQALNDPGFLSMMGAIYSQANQFEVAQSLLERSAKVQSAAGGQPSTALELQLAAVYLQRGQTEQAYAIYHQVLTDNPNSADAWKGFIATLQSTSHNAEALQEIAVIPAPVRKQLESDIEFLQSEASLYAATGDVTHAIQYMNRVEDHYAALKTEPPANIEVQNAWLLFNTSNDRALYSDLMRLGGRKDLTATQRETVQDIWASWSVRRAATAMDNGNLSRAVEILDAASQAFPDNLTVRKAVAGGYVRVGRSRESLALYKTVPMQDASAGDFQGAVGSALAANDKAMAEVWLRQALERFPHDPAILSLAARFEQARGDNQRAADYYRASLAAMPRTSPTDKLAHELVYPEQDSKVRRAVTAADLQRLLDPEYEPFAKTAKTPPLPAYGLDPYNRAPVVVSPAQRVATAQQAVPVEQVPQVEEQVLPQQVPQTVPQAVPQTLPQPAQSNPGWISNPSGDDLPLPQTQDLNPTGASIRAIPSTQTPDAQLFHQQSYKLPHMGAPDGDPLVYTIFRPANGSPKGGPSGSVVRFLVDEETDLAQPLFEAASLGQVQQQVQDQSQASQPAQLATNAPHTMASDAWKGLIFSLMADNHYDEALQEIGKMPPDIRKILESDVDFEQGEAGLYSALGDTRHSLEYLNRVEDSYLVHRASAPAGLEVQHAWLLFNLKDDLALYPLLMRLDVRQDLGPALHQQLDNLWANLAVRRASSAMDGGNILRGVQLLQAASEDYPDNLIIRRAVAGAYTKVGRSTEALALYKTIPWDDAGSGDYQGAIGAALAATDLAQAEAWLRIALGKFPSDPGILAAAARFEQTRGNNQRASDFWRAAINAMPPGSPVEGLQTGVSLPTGGYKPPQPGELKHLLDPRFDPPPRTNAIPPLPTYPSAPFNPTLPKTAAAPAVIQRQQPQWVSTPSTNPLPLSGFPSSQQYGPSYTPGTVPNQQQLPPTTNRSPIYVPQSMGAPSRPISQPVLIQQSATNKGNTQTPATGKRTAKSVHSLSGNASGSNPYEGQMTLPPSEQNIGGADVATGISAHDSEPSAGSIPVPAASRSDSAEGLRITSQPMNDVAAQAQAQFAGQTDGQLTTGSATTIQALPPLTPPAEAQYHYVPPAVAQYSLTQYTPSAQEAATGAYSAPRQQVQQPPVQPEQPPAPVEKPSPVSRAPRRRRVRAKKHAAAPVQRQAQTLQNAQPSEPAQDLAIPEDVPTPTAPATIDTGLTDEELQQRNLPPLRGPWVRVQREARAISPRDEAEMQLRAIESGYSGWVGGAGLVNYRTGDLGYDHLSALEAPFEASFPLGYHARMTIVARPVFLDSGQATGTSVITVQESTTAGTTLLAIPQPIGTLTATDTTPPGQQNAVGIGGEVQLSFAHLAIAGGYTPAGFLVATFTGRAMWKPGNGPFTFNFSRDSVKDTQLSYAGLRDPAGNTLGNMGQIWGGVVANQGQVQYARGDAESGFYIGAGGQYLTGYQVENNTRFDGSGGAYWRLLTSPENGNLSIGANFFGMHYAHNEGAFTYGMGGYFSPAAYFLANVPFTWVGHVETRWHYTVLGSLGVQAFQQNATPLFPLAAQTASEIALDDAMLPAKTSVGPNYDLRGAASYQVSPHWFVGGFFGANNSRNYTSVNAGFSVHYMFRSQPSTATTPTGMFPTDGLRPFTVP